MAGVKENWGANVGSVLLDTYGEDVRTKARAYAAAGSDARMSGCELPVVINSGSGNQGITVSVPVIIYAKEYHKSDEELLRASFGIQILLQFTSRQELDHCLHFAEQ